MNTRIIRKFASFTPSKMSNLHHRMPTTFGPFPGPRQSFDGRARDGSGISNVEAFITFKAQQSDLASLLPPTFSFQKPGLEAYVSITAKRLDNLEWLAGRGYNLLSVYIHGVQYTTEEGGRVYRGTYLPVLWEDMADPIISGREELGFPKLYADLNISQTESTYSMIASWDGSKFAELSLRGLHTEENQDGMGSRRLLAPPEAGVDEGILLWRYMPSTGHPGQADVDYPVFVSHAEEEKKQQARVIKRLVAGEGEFKWHPLDWQALPTLHHIVARLERIHTLDIVACGLVEKVGGGDLSSARRVGSEQPSL
ncbi:hypothetical protein GL218_01220 [Daldinia childiae]|uniref:uncharacterized protein n=1 Tax=Daldinia childiae TaxID=326645 RepID=UPI00144541C6|nr:uncharacterized protein GL218_01220 [Daldinia childiae]KAF3064101.1 hypothetical protein GL218_01220 [Daldinia childiae]